MKEACSGLGLLDNPAAGCRRRCAGSGTAAAGCQRQDAVPDPGQPFWQHRSFSKTQHRACGRPRQRQELPWLRRGSRRACSGSFLAEPCSAWSLEYAASYFKGAKALGEASLGSGLCREGAETWGSGARETEPTCGCTLLVLTRCGHGRQSCPGTWVTF